MRPLGTREPIGKVGGRFSDHPVGPRPEPQAASHLVTLFEPPTRGWLPEAINGLLGHEALGDKGDYRVGWGRFPDHPVGPRLNPRAPSRLVTLFEPPTRGWLPEAINVTAYAYEYGWFKIKNSLGTRTTLT